jgi:DNA-binding HxlR family transcriptional regulator
VIPTDIEHSEEHAACRALTEVLSLIGDKWTIMAVGNLSFGPKRFNELRRLIGGITQRMLTRTLKGLEENGIVGRTVFPTVPPRVDYELTPLGHKLIEPLQALREWAGEHQAAMRQAREKFARKNQTKILSPRK